MVPILKFMLVTFAFIGVAKAWSAPQVPCLFIFGDSLVDNGNNNALLTLARANYKPYGIDFPGGYSGRFSNGRTSIDILAQLLGFQHFIPPYATAQNSDVLRGLNYASGAAGIRRETGIYLGMNYPFTKQVDHFRDTVQLMQKAFRGNTTRLGEHLSQCIYSVGVGSNDYLNNYFMPYLYPSSYHYSPQKYSALLLQEYSKQLSRLHDLGARKVVVYGLGQIGCIPYELARYDANGQSGSSRCNEKINNAIQIFNTGLLKMVKRFNSELPGSKFIYVNSFDTSKDLVTNPKSYGFEVIDKGCCGLGRNNGQVTCLPFEEPCKDRSKYLFWDAFHPTEAANIIYANKAYSSNSTVDVYPINIRELAAA